MGHRQRWAVVVGLGSFVCGIAWIAVWSARLHSDPNMHWLTSEVPTPLGARLLVLSGAVLLIGTGITWLVLRRRKQ